MTTARTPQNKTTSPALPSVVPDSRNVPLSRLAAGSGDATTGPLRLVLPGGAEGRVPVAAFGSSI